MSIGDWSDSTHFLMKHVLDADFQRCVQELMAAIQKPSKGEGQKNMQLRQHLEIIVADLRQLALCLRPILEHMATISLTIEDLKQGSVGGFDTMKQGAVKCDYGNYQYTTLLKAVCMVDGGCCHHMRSLSGRMPTLSMYASDTEQSLVNQGNVVECCLACVFGPQPGDSDYDTQAIVRLRALLCRVSMSVDMVYQVLRKGRYTKRGVEVKSHIINRQRTEICTKSTEVFAAVLVALSNTKRNDAEAAEEEETSERATRFFVRTLTHEALRASHLDEALESRRSDATPAIGSAPASDATPLINTMD